MSMEQALAGLKVLDLTWALVGPAAIRNLGDCGATVIKVESTTRIDPIRAGPPFMDGTPGTERSAEFANYNANKYGVTLNLNTEGGRELLLRLVGWADVVAEAFTPGTMENWGLSADRLIEENPSLIVASTSLNGQTGPDAGMGGYGVQGAALAGNTNFLGWADRAPSLPGAYTDYVASRYFVIAILAALEHRRRTGDGQRIDLSQVEASIHFVAPGMLAHSANGEVLGRDGNRVAGASPHGVFPSSGDDRWVAIEVWSDAEWAALCRAAGHEEWLSDTRFATHAARKENEDDLEAAIALWTREQDPEAAAKLLREAGVGAAWVLPGRDAGEDAQLTARGHFIEVQSSDLGAVKIEGNRFALSRTPAKPSWVPTYGEHNEQVLKDFLGLTDDEIAEYAAGGALE